RPKQFIAGYGPLLALLACNALFWVATREIRPSLDIVPPVPGREELAALKMGDDQFYFRVLALEMQNAGDTYGRFTPLHDYSMERIYHWFTLLDGLDDNSDMLPAMASYYFSQTQHHEEVRPLVNYLYEHSVRDIEHKWWWLLQSIYLAQYKLEDMDLALKAAKPLVDKSVPIWAQQMAAVVHEKRGEMEDALGIMETIKNNADAIPDRDLRYMVYFVKERLKRLDKLKDFEGLKTVPDEPNNNRPDLNK
ncbi:MAG: hypothetical protein SFX19_09800, partial [Alphaproteobacteria bacterium]|nr:hypothetical protein [Alphaproteobacteria bacterium]